MGAWAGHGVDGLTISEGHVLTTSLRNVVRLATRTTSTPVRPRSCINRMKDGRGSSPETGLAQGSRRRFRGNPPENTHTHTHTPLPPLSGITVAISAGCLEIPPSISEQFRDTKASRNLEISRRWMCSGRTSASTGGDYATDYIGASADNGRTVHVSPQASATVQIVIGSAC